MKEKLKDFINNNRDAFDDALPGEENWDKIKMNLQHKKVVRIFPVRQVAASVIILLSAAVVFLLVEKRGTIPPVEKAPVAVSANAPEYLDPAYQAELNRISFIVEAKETQLKIIQKTDPVLYHKFIGAVNQLDSSYSSLEKELNTNPNKEQLLKAMIENLQLQQQLLNQQLSIFQHFKQLKNEKLNKNI